MTFASSTSAPTHEAANMPKHPAVFVDRDGTLMEEVCYCNDPSKVRLIEGSADGLRRLRASGYRTVLVTNQAGIARGLITPDQYAAVHARLLELLGPETLDATYMCPAGPDEASTHRKPAPGMLLQAAEELHLDLSRSWMVGDKAIDLHCGNNAGVSSILVLTGYGRSVNPKGEAHVFESFYHAASWILAGDSSKKPSAPCET
jgi:D-glycero-D-manno-heptose 1,7-bisphosphate phosphatase